MRPTKELAAGRDAADKEARIVRVNGLKDGGVQKAVRTDQLALQVHA